MDIKTIKALAELMEQKNLSCLTFNEGEDAIHMERGGVIPLAAPCAPVAAPAVVADAPAEPATTPTSPQPGSEALTSPLVGIAYFASAPGEEPFVRPGDKVKKGQTLCIIESMKVMNEFAAPRAGEVAVVCFEDGQLVEYGQPLFHLI